MDATNPPDDVEFLDDPADDSADVRHDAVASRRAWPPVGANLVATLLALAGAALAVTAPFQVAYSLGVSGRSVLAFATDGWGRDRSPGEMTDPSQHGPRYGIVYCTAAGLVLVGIVLWELFRRRQSGRASIGSAAVLVGAGAILATTVNLLLAALANLESLQFNLAREDMFDDEDGGSHGVASLSPGWLLWLGFAATVLLVAAVIVRRHAPDNAPDDAPDEAPDGGQGTEPSHPDSRPVATG